MRWREKTFGDLAESAKLYRPFIGAVVALLLVALVLPGTRTNSSVDAGNEGGGVQSFTARDDVGAATDQGDVAGGLPDAGNLSGGSSAGTGGRSASSVTGSRPAPGAPLAVSETAGASVGCDAATGRIAVPTVYAPPCVPDFSGENAGATWQGVTADSIKIAVYLPQEDPASGAILDAAGIDDSLEQIEQTYRDYVDYFEAHYQTYGRKVELEFLISSGADADDASGKADAIKVATEIKAFASWGGRVLTDSYQDELAARGVLCICPKVPPIEYYLDKAPFYYSTLMASTQGYTHRAEYVGKRLWGRNAQWAGDPLYQQQKRKLAIVYTETAEGDFKPGIDFFEKELAKYGAKLDDRIAILLDIPRLQEQSRTIIARLKEKGITSVIIATTFLDPIFLTGEATRQAYLPEWIVTGSALTDTTVWARLYDQQQWANAFGVSLLSGRLVAEKTDPWALHVWHHGRPPAADDTFAVIYAPAFQFYTGLHLAGPALTPQTFRDGTFSYPPSGGGITSALVSFGRHGIWPFDDYSAFDDGTEVWWDAIARGPDETGADGQGMYRYVDGGVRYLPGSWPSSDPKAFDPAGTVTVYDEPPPQDRAPSYEHQPHG